MDAILLIKIFVAVAAAAVLIWRIASIHSREAGGRTHMLDAFEEAVEYPRMRRSPWGYPRLDGSLDGYLIRVDLVPDTLVQRTLPTLWLEARWARPHEGRICVIRDPVGAEYSFDTDQFPTRIAPPPGWPSRTEVRSAGARVDLLQRLARFDIEGYPALKQICLTDNEVKVTMRCARGDRNIYRVLRSATFPGDAVSTEFVAETINALRAVEAAVESPIVPVVEEVS